MYLSFVFSLHCFVCVCVCVLVCAFLVLKVLPDSFFFLLVSITANQASDFGASGICIIIITSSFQAINLCLLVVIE